jgi:hypothetical protein
MDEDITSQLEVPEPDASAEYPVDKHIQEATPTNEKSKNKVSKSRRKKKLKNSGNEDIDKIKASETPKNSGLEQSSQTGPTSGVLAEYESRVPQWSGVIDFQNVANVHVINTCTIDNLLFALWVLYKQVPHVMNAMPDTLLTHTIKLITTSIQNNDWKLARQYWIVNIMQGIIIRNDKIDLFGNEFATSTRYLLPLRRMI